MIQAMIKNGKVIPEEIPAPNASEGCVLIKVVNSCISAGTELAGLGGGPDPSAKVPKPLNLTNIKKGIKALLKEGPPAAFAKAKLVISPPKLAPQEDTSKWPGRPTGYSVSGIVIPAGSGVTEFRLGDAVAAAGGAQAYHAEFVEVPVNLVVPVPADMNMAAASTVALGGIAMQGVRRADLRLGEFAVVVGTGILGLLAVQMLKATGVRVIAVSTSTKIGSSSRRNWAQMR